MSANINGYLIEEHCDRECWDHVEFYSAFKKWDDGSFDFISVDSIPNKVYCETTLFKYICELCKNRTLLDIINDHYNFIAKQKDDWLDDSSAFVNLSLSYIEFKNKNYSKALELLNSINNKKYCKRSIMSLIKHLERLISQENEI